MKACCTFICSRCSSSWRLCGFARSSLGPVRLSWGPTSSGGGIEVLSDGGQQSAEALQNLFVVVLQQLHDADVHDDLCEHFQLEQLSDELHVAHPAPAGVVFLALQLLSETLLLLRLQEEQSHGEMEEMMLRTLLNSSWVFPCSESSLSLSTSTRVFFVEDVSQWRRRNLRFLRVHRVSSTFRHGSPHPKVASKHRSDRGPCLRHVPVLHPRTRTRTQRRQQSKLRICTSRTPAWPRGIKGGASNLKSSPMGMPPSCSMGEMSSARYSQIVPALMSCCSRRPMRSRAMVLRSSVDSRPARGVNGSVFGGDGHCVPAFVLGRLPSALVVTALAAPTAPSTSSIVPSSVVPSSVVSASVAS
ncbi:hypothetical protein F7725_021153 [Dissostichus mawsoni]|uniref:Uncharacterized protein n=1 Tax=Dissostichus mawsoni TaxID=36200 RepID=A0A7J5YFB7_DISMA|nr:hypothetical protein F7725_021153 [Dissostichus mawsoni]